MRLLGIAGGVEITSIADIPARGSGLGSSSSFTVGLLHVLHAYVERFASAEQLAREASIIEIERCREPIGKQDQYAAAFGGLNFIEFQPDDTVTVEPIICKRETVRQIQSHTLVFYTGMTRRASPILQHQNASMAKKKNREITRKLAELARQLRKELQQNHVASIGEIIHEGWCLKKSLGPAISSNAIDAWYQKARDAGATGGKLLGAGAGGFLLFYAPPDRHEAITRALGKLRRMDFRFEPQGSRIIFVH
jgi:D-glycero-alpha-D-manno-heptose-7-phosphate kinase